jgi:hypothetical protein
MFDPFLSNYRPSNSRVPGAVFGEIGGHKSAADLQDFLTSVRYRMTQMDAALGKVVVNPVAVKDPTAFAALMVDAGNLKTRVSRADANATQFLSAIVTPLAYTPAQGPYDALLKSIRQNAPPDGAPLQRGDYDDVINRIKQVGGVAVDLSQMPQPKAVDPDRAFIQYSTPVAHIPDLVPHVPDLGDVFDPFHLRDFVRWIRDHKTHGPDLGDVFDPFHLRDFVRWIRDHKTEVTIVACLVGGLILYKMWIGTKYVAVHAAPHIIPAAKLAAETFIPGGRLATLAAHAASPAKVAAAKAAMSKLHLAAL